MTEEPDLMQALEDSLRKPTPTNAPSGANEGDHMSIDQQDATKRALAVLLKIAEDEKQDTGHRINAANSAAATARDAKEAD